MTARHDPPARSGVWEAARGGLRMAGAGEALVSERLRLSGNEVLAAVSAGASRLVAEGVRPGEPIGCLSGGQPETIVARLVALALGCPFVHLVQGVPVEVAARTMRALGVSALLYEPSRAGEMDPLLAAHPAPVRRRLGWTGTDLFAAPHPPQGPSGEPGRAAPGVLGSVAFTNGTTGERKAVAYSRRAEEAQLAAALAVCGHGPWRFLVRSGHHLPNELALWTLATGGTAVLTDNREDGLPELAVREGVTHFLAGRPFEFHALEGELEAGRFRLVMYGGAPAVPSHTWRTAGRLGEVLLQTYGLTEAGFVTALTPADHLRPDLLASVGRPLPGVEVSVREGGGEVPAGEAGEVWVRSPQAMSGYVRHHEALGESRDASPGDRHTTDAPPDERHATDALPGGRHTDATPDGWVRTGDVGRMDAAGYLFLLDRAENRLPHGVHAHPVEHVLTGHPSVTDAAVFALPGGPAGPVLAAAVVARDGGATQECLKALVRHSLGDRSVPEHLWLVGEIPRTRGGKPDKAALRARYAAPEARPETRPQPPDASRAAASHS
ncbi:class I adenylate-forming enzyme family protein [Nonomuraea rhizosphaerae]|uniref:class I adenylate-forming enzyme family protein n=1 Tax=Nonomuraea rhizosphaerae TaxID=2665663 RepID=UPI001C605379|nr:class I adenylate-forming enzyme family protein [Nonomuraea rhizosphaerae]